MLAPRIFVIVGNNWRTGDLIEYGFDRVEVEARCDALNQENRDEYACRVECCSPMGGESSTLGRWQR